MRSACLAAALLLSACIRSGATTCADGTICREGTVCATVEERTLCVTQQQLDACEGKEKFDSCGDDRCYAIDDGLVCLPIACGNHFTDPEEQCDDGNNTSRDGCSADCFSNEQCGNNVIDSHRGERCDDGNTISHDGCSSRCDIESPRWMDIDRDAPSDLRTKMSATFDVRRGRVVAFGGTEPGVSSSTFFPRTTWEWDRAWFEDSSLTSPEGRAEAALAYDDRRGVTVMFGGLRTNGFSGDTWEWSGTDWAPVDVVGPPVRAGAAMAYDAAGDRVVLFGGRDDAKTLDDTWQLRDGTWTKIASIGPKASDLATMTYDPIRGVIVLISRREQWELVGDTWTPIATTVPAIDTSYPYQMWLAFDVGAQKLLLLGSSGSAGSTTWEWTGQAWSALSRASVDYTNIAFVVADRLRGGLVARVGADIVTWDATGSYTKVVTPVLDLHVARGAAAANDLRRRVAIVFGGNVSERGNAPLRKDTTHAFDGAVWTELSPSKKPLARWGHAMAYDIERDRIVMFGGDIVGGLSAETWLWDGTTWTDAMPATSPPPRRGHAMAYDRDTGRVVMFGGVDASGVRDDTWEWTGTTWHASTSGDTPSARVGAVMAHDPIGGGLLLFGGVTDPETGVSHDDTWRYTMTGWTRVNTVVSPPPRAFATLTLTPARRRLLLVGGERVENVGLFERPVPIEDTWEWDGARWQALSGSSRLVTEHVALFRPDGAEVITVGGNTMSSVPEPRTTHRWQDRSAYETCAGRLDADGDGLAGCADLDCWSACTPLCLPGETCTTQPRCGDGACSALESMFSCPEDCGAAATLCGDAVCDGSETCAGECS